MPKDGIDHGISQRINVIRYAMILGIVALHMPPYQSLEALDSSGFDLVKGFFSHGLFRATTPTLTAIAGFLLFRSGLDTSPAQLLKTKSRTILLPLIAWNLPLALVLLAMQAITSSTAGFRIDMLDANLAGWLDAVLGLTDAPVNYPLFFLRDLFVLCLFAPQIGMLLRSAPWCGAALVTLASLMDLNGPVIMRDTMLINFYLGGMAAVLVKDLRAADRYGPYCLLLLIGYSLAIPLFDLADRTFFVIIAPLLVWPAASLFMHTRAARWLARNASASFFTFLAHGPLLVVAWAVHKALWGADQFAEIAWFLMPVAVSAGCLGVYRVIRQLDSPRLNIAIGGR